MKSILLVDDNVDILEMVSEALVLKGYQVITCNKSVQAMEKIKKHKPNLIVSDIQMPGLTGRDLILELKDYDDKIPVILLSAKVGMKNDIEFKLAKNVKAFVEKPFALTKLTQTIEKILPPSFSPEKLFSGDYHSLIGQSIGNCILDEMIGVGGTGIVYRGQHLSLNILVAVKVLLPSCYTDVENIKRFLREAQVLASIEHPNIVQILNADKEEGIYFLVMRYVEGESLYRYIQSMGKLDPIRGTKIILKAAYGLAAAHNQGLLHRDIKPSNILISRDESNVKIIDFGLARQARQDDPITQQGIVLGTPGYMSPEQCLNEPMDERTDIYSLGATFYETITGQGPFNGDSIVRLMAQLQGNFISPNLLDDTIPIEVSEMINKMLNKDKNRRHPNMGSVIEDLEKILKSLH